MGKLRDLSSFQQVKFTRLAIPLDAGRNQVLAEGRNKPAGNLILDRSSAKIRVGLDLEIPYSRSVCSAMILIPSARSSALAPISSAVAPA